MGSDSNMHNSLDADILQCKSDILKALRSWGIHSEDDFHQQSSSDKRSGSVPTNAVPGKEDYLDEHTADIHVPNDPSLSNDKFIVEKLTPEERQSLTPPPSEQNHTTEAKPNDSTTDINKKYLLLQTEYEQLQSELEIENSRLLNLQEDLEFARAASQATENKNNELSDQITTLTEQRDQLKSQIDTSEEKIKQLQQPYEQLREECDILQNQLDQAHSECASVTRELDQTTQDYTEYRKNKIKEIDALKEKLSAIKEVELQSNEAASQLKTELESLRGQARDNHFKINTFDQIHSELIDTQNENNRLSKENRTLYSQKQEQEDETAQLRHSLNEQAEKLRQTNSQIESLTELKQTLESDKKDLINRINELETDYETLNKEIDTRRSFEDILHRNEHENLKLKEEIKDKIFDLEKIRHDMDDLKKENSDYKDKIAMLEVDISKTQESNKSVQSSEQFIDSPVIAESNLETKSVPTFNLAEQIMAEHRRHTARKRVAPGPGEPTETTTASTSVKNVVTQFVQDQLNQQIDQKNLDSDDSNMPKRSKRQIVDFTSKANFWSKDLLSTPQSRLLTSIVNRDIAKFTAGKKRSSSR